MGRNSTLTHEEIAWAHRERCRGCTMAAVAAALGVDRRTLQREFKRRGLNVPIPIPDEKKKKPAKL